MSDPKRWLDDPEAPGHAVRLVAAFRPPEAFSHAAEDSIRERLAGTLANVPPAAAAAKFGSLKLAAASGLVLGAGVLVAYFVAVGGESEPAPDSTSRQAVTAPAPKPPSAPVAEVAPVVEQPADTTRSKEREKSVAPPRASNRGDSLAFEESLLERARKASDSSPETALALLRDHERRFPAGELTAERLFLMAKASANAGNEAAARRYGRELERRFPKSAYLPELRALLPGPFTPPRSTR